MKTKLCLFSIDLLDDVPYPEYLDLEDGRIAVFSANGSHGTWAQPGIYNLHIYQSVYLSTYLSIPNTWIWRMAGLLCSVLMDPMAHGLNQVSIHLSVYLSTYLSIYQEYLDLEEGRIAIFSANLFYVFILQSIYQSIY